MSRGSKVFIIALIALLSVLVVYSAVRDKPGASTGDDLGLYFKDRLILLGVADVGQPIEGFDAELLIMAFPGLAPSDFQDVKTLEGHYEVKDGKLEFNRDEGNPISSAERMIVDDGYRILLTNVSKRLEVRVVDEGSIDEIVQKINTKETLRTRIGEGASALGVNIIPLEVLEDSRCPLGVTCIWAGRVRLKATLQSSSGTAEQVFILNEPITTEAEEITLVRVEPEKMSATSTQVSEYIFYFEIKKRSV